MSLDEKLRSLERLAGTGDGEAQERFDLLRFRAGLITIDQLRTEHSARLLVERAALIAKRNGMLAAGAWAEAQERARVQFAEGKLFHTERHHKRTFYFSPRTRRGTGRTIAMLLRAAAAASYGQRAVIVAHNAQYAHELQSQAKRLLVRANFVSWRDEERTGGSTKLIVGVSAQSKTSGSFGVAHVFTDHAVGDLSYDVGMAIFAACEKRGELTLSAAAASVQGLGLITGTWTCTGCGIDTEATAPYEPGDAEPCIYCDGTARVTA